MKKPDKFIFILAGVLTIVLFSMIYGVNLYMNNQRENFLDTKMGDFLDQYEEMQSLSLMSDSFGENMTCLAMKARKSEMDKSLWTIGIKLDQYRALTEEYMNNPYYLDQKKKFNRNEAIYLSMLRSIENRCSLNETIVLFFYKKKEECPDCDAQSFVLTDIKKDMESAKDEISMFSFDADLDVQSVNVLTQYYNITTLPCTVIEDKPYCNLRNKEEFMNILCSLQNYTVCKE